MAKAKNTQEKDIKKCTEKGAWEDGGCCCNCRHQLKVMKHPWNNSKRFKGAMSEDTGMFVCAVQMDVEYSRTAIAFERKHGYCEMHTPYKEKIKTK